MKKLFLALMLALASTSALAEWTWVVEDAGIGITVYVDRVSINKTGNVVKMLTLVDFRAAQGKAKSKFLSQKEQGEYDCKEAKIRILTLSRSDKNLGAGEVVFSDNTPSKWMPVAPGSANEVLWEIACGKQLLPPIFK